MSEWHLTPNYILHEMTEEQLALLFDKRNERIRAMNQPAEERDKPVKYNRMSDTDFFAAHGVVVGNV